MTEVITGVVETVTITAAEYEELLHRSLIFTTIENLGGIDEDIYDTAVEMINMADN